MTEETVTAEDLLLAAPEVRGRRTRRNVTRQGDG